MTDFFKFDKILILTWYLPTRAATYWYFALGDCIAFFLLFRFVRAFKWNSCKALSNLSLTITAFLMGNSAFYMASDFFGWLRKIQTRAKKSVEIWSSYSSTVLYKTIALLTRSPEPIYHLKTDYNVYREHTIDSFTKEIRDSWQYASFYLWQLMDERNLICSISNNNGNWLTMWVCWINLSNNPNLIAIFKPWII